MIYLWKTLKSYCFLFIIATILSSCATIKRDEIVDLEIGIQAWEDGNYRQAISSLKQYKDANYLPINQIIAISYLKINQPDSALLWLNNSATKDVNSANMYFGLLSQEVQNKNYSDNLSFLEFVNDVADKHNFDPGLLLAFMQQESDFIADAISKTGAVGLMQLMPATAKALGLKVPPENESYTPTTFESHLDERFNPAKNINAAANHIAFLIRHYQKNKDETNLRKAIAAYYAGTGVVSDSIPSYCKYYLKQISKNYKNYRYNQKNHKLASKNFTKRNRKIQAFFKKKSKYSNYKKSLQTYIEKSKEEIKKLKNNKTRAIFFNNLALIYEGINVPSQAENLYQLALINHKNETIYFNYGLFLYEHNEFKKAQKQFAHLKDTKHLTEMADILMSSYYLQVGSLDKAFALIWDNNYLFFEAERLNNLGIYYLMKSNFSEAIHLFSQSLDKKDSIITTNNLMATLYYKSYSDESRLDFTKLHRSLFIKKSDLIWPTKKINITSQYGWRPDPIKIDWNDKIETMDFHNGIDLSGTKQDTVFAISAGIIESVKTFKGGGKTVYIQHKDSSHSVYMHLSKILVAEKEKIQQGSPIGIVGNTGISTAPHLHLGIYDKNWNSINPITVLPQIDTFE